MFFSLSGAEGIDSLLNEYEQESELSKKTKDESAGNLIVYTRDDLERMQVESLKDILKSLRLFAYTENRMGQPDILNQDPLNYYSSSIRVYLNENELATGITGSGLIAFGDMEMDFIDHVEIYQGFPSFDFGIEPATVVIRLYSKSAQHDEGGRAKINISTNGANKENVYYTNQENGLSYFIYANHTDNKKESHTHSYTHIDTQGATPPSPHTETLEHSTETNRFYGSVGTENHTVDFHLMQTKGDALLGPRIGSLPDNTYKENNYINLSTNSKFMDDSLILNLSYIKSTIEYLSEYVTGKSPYPIADTDPLINQITSYNQKVDEDIFTAALKKKWDLESHALTLGVQYRYKTFDMSERRINGSPNPKPQPYDKEDIYSVFIQDLITLDENNLVTLSVMDQEYVRNDDVDNQNTLQLRFGYIYTNREWVAKTFISSQEFATEPFMLIANPALKEVTYKSILQEVSYKTEQTLSKVIVGFGNSENMIIPDLDPLTPPIKNSPLKVDLRTAIAEFTYYFSEKDRLELQANYWCIESPEDVNADPTEHMSYIVRMLNSLSKFDIFNELVIHTGYTDIDDSFDYSAGVKYQVNRDFHLNIKAENIFDNSLDSDYYNQIVPTVDKVVIPTVERRFTFGMEYLF